VTVLKRKSAFFMIFVIFAKKCDFVTLLKKFLKGQKPGNA
jgi:hypothetical protein